MTALKKFKLAIILLVSVIIFGTGGYMIIEGGSFLESLYMTVITISTVGFKEVFPLTPTSMTFTIVLIFFSLSILAFGVNIISSFIIEGQFRDINRRRIMNKKLQNLSDHYIVCGSGQSTQQVIKQLQSSNVSFVVINHRTEPEEEREKIRKREDILHFEGDATDDDSLKKAKIKKAKGLIAALSTDTDNLFLILSARSLNSNLSIVARAIEENSLKKMRKAGADHVISPDIIGGSRMASMILRPAIIDFLDIICKSSEEISLKMEQVTIPAKSSLKNKTLREVQIPQKTGLIVVAVKPPDTEKFTYNPGPEYNLNENDVLVVLGNDEQINKLKKYIKK